MTWKLGCIYFGVVVLLGQCGLSSASCFSLFLMNLAGITCFLWLRMLQVFLVHCYGCYISGILKTHNRFKSREQYIAGVMGSVIQQLHNICSEVKASDYSMEEMAILTKLRLPTLAPKQMIAAIARNHQTNIIGVAIQRLTHGNSFIAEWIYPWFLQSQIREAVGKFESIIVTKTYREANIAVDQATKHATTLEHEHILFFDVKPEFVQEVVIPYYLYLRCNT